MNNRMNSIQIQMPMDNFFKEIDSIVKEYVEETLPELTKDYINDQYNLEDIVENMVSMEINNMDIQSSIIESVDYKKLANALLSVMKEGK